LETFAVDDIVTDPLTVFSWSYRTLESEAASLFRLLGLHPGPEVGIGAAASLLGIPQGRARSLLMRLAHTNLATEVAPGRFALHDLLRSYARQLVQAHDESPWRDAARRRMIDHYLYTGYTAAILLDPLRDPIPIPVTLPTEGTTIDRLADHRDALRWFRQEHPVLLRVVEHAAAAGMDRSTGQLAWCLSCYLDLQGHMADLAATQRAAYHAAARLENTCLQTVAGRLLARALSNLGEHDKGRSLLKEILDLGTPVDRAHTNAALCLVEHAKGDHSEALRHARSALDLFRGHDHPVGQARALNLIGWCQLHVGNAVEAAGNCRQALRLLDRVRDRIVEGNTWDTLGLASHHLGKPGVAIECYERALAIHQDLGNRLHEAETLLHMAHSCDTLGDHQRAEKARRDAEHASRRVFSRSDLDRVGLER
jgi:tetratricopeptide (TPR) repeat protein